MNRFRRFRDFAFSVALLSIPFFFLSTNLKDPARVNVLDRVLLQVSAPIQYVAAEAARSISGVLEGYVYLVDVNRENQRLSHDNGQLRSEIRSLRIQARENNRLRRMLDLRERLAGETLSAKVISKDFSTFFRIVRVRLDRGERHHVRPGMPVISVDGLVGQIRRTAGRYSDVLLTVDRTSAVDVLIPRTGARGMLRGTGEDDRYACRIQYLRRTDQVRVGDEIYTSGLGQRFPASILVGHVVKVVKRDFGLYQEAMVDPAVNFADLEEALILTTGPRQSGTQDASPSGTATTGAR